MFNGKFDFKLSFFRDRSHPLIGVDIGSSAIKLVELSKSGNNYQLEHYAIEPLPKDAITDGAINNLEVVAACLERAWNRLGSNTRNVCMALPASAVITRRILLAAGLDEEVLELQIEAEASQYIPFAMEEVNLDFQVLGPAPGNAEEIVVFLAASRKANVEDRVAAAQSAGLKAVIIDVESYAEQVAFGLISPLSLVDAEESLVALVDVGSNSTNINVLKGGESIYSRDQQVGGDQLNRQIQGLFGLSPEEAEIAKRKGGLPDNYVTDVLDPFRENVAMEVMRALQFFYSSSPYSDISKLIVAGGGAGIEGLVAAIGKQTGIPTELVNPFVNMSLSKRITQRQLLLDAPSLLVACGLALRRFDPS
ncbi:Cell division protein FtsA [Ferriphaselus amnicola]|uniref:Cell division protein FtsA n=1 Tax=Ferriphaselus amnicola TaxID=1188319 RepID=A0A2Z6GEK1_9PROT|nr:pilus assembly protein PilM [Ferriphaselus amnicola]BBE52006.1 Cell division protein FtsA [Ferriphaselus amnicola]